MSVGHRDDALVREYLRRLGWGLREMDANDRDQLMAEITDHIARARAERPASAHDVRAVLDRLGPPETIVAEVAKQRPVRSNGGTPHPSEAGEAAMQMLVEGVAADWTEDGAATATGDRRTVRPPAAASDYDVARDRRAVNLLLAGGLLLVVGWFVGVALLWRSRFFSVGDKIVATLILPGGVLPAIYVLARPAGGSGWLVRLLEVALCVLLPVTTWVYLRRRLRAVQVASGFETFRVRRAAHAAERARGEQGLG